MNYRLAIERGHYKFICPLTEYGFEIQDFVVQYAINNGKSRVVEELLKSGISPRGWMSQHAKRVGFDEIARIIDNHTYNYQQQIKRRRR